MLKYFFVALFLLLLGNAIAQSEGELKVTVTTSKAGGGYAPKNIVAIWIEKDSGGFVKTLLAYADKRKSHLNNWEKATIDAGFAYNTTDAITGATRSNHNTYNCTWNGTNYERILIADGQYKLCMELTDKNATGNYASFSFSKTGESVKLTPDNVTSFSNILMEWTPKQTSTSVELMTNSDLQVYPSPTNGIIEINGSDILSVKVTSLNGKTVYDTNNNNYPIDLTKQPNGVYFVYIKTAKETWVRKIIKHD